MRNKLKWFDTDDVMGYIEYKKDGNIIICCSNKDNLEEYVKLELHKTGEIYELKKRLD